MKAIIKLGYDCNNSCVFCHAKQKKGHLDFKGACRKIDAAPADTVLFSGGEPAIRKDIFDILAYAKSKGLDTGLVTNCRMLSNERFCRIFDYNLKYIYTTLSGSRKELNNSITRSDSFDQIIKGISYSLKAGAEVLVNIVIVKENLHDLNQMVELLKSLNVKKIKLSFVEPISTMDHVPDMNEAAERVKEILDKHKEAGWDGFPLCLMKGYEEKICSLETNDIRFISEAYEDKFYPADEGDRIRLAECGGCARCSGVYRLYAESRKALLEPY